MSKATLSHLFGCICAVICAVTSFFAFVSLWASLSDYTARQDPTEGVLLSLLNPSSLIFGAIALGTFGMTISAFSDKIFDALQSPGPKPLMRVFHPVLRLVGAAPPTPPKIGHSSARRTSFFNLNSWQVGGILAVLLFFAGIGWHHLSLIMADAFRSSFTQQSIESGLPVQSTEAPVESSEQQQADSVEGPVEVPITPLKTSR